MDFPCSYGEGDVDRNVTRSGIHVVTEKYEDFYMTNPAAGYANVRERFAVRISNNGEFIHANPASSGAQGNTNVTNGCINLSTEDAQQYFNSAIYGDPVEVTGTRIELSYADGDIWDWAVAVGRVGIDVGVVGRSLTRRDPQHRACHAVGRAAARQRPPRRLAAIPWTTVRGPRPAHTHSAHTRTAYLRPAHTHTTYVRPAHTHATYVRRCRHVRCCVVDGHHVVNVRPERKRVEARRAVHPRWSNRRHPPPRYAR